MKHRRATKLVDSNSKGVEKTPIKKVVEQSSSSSLSIIDSLTVFLLPTVSLTYLYLSTIFPSVAGGDSPELISEACVGGVAHPPGYPLFTMLVQLALKFPIPNNDSTSYWTPAARANALCCILGGVTCGFISLSTYFASFHLLPNITTSTRVITILSCVSASVLYGTSSLAWEYSTGAEVFALNNALASSLLCLTCWYAAVTPAARHSGLILAAGAFICGLGLTNQHTIILLEAPLILFILYSSRNNIGWSHRFVLALLFVNGLLPYFYTVIAGYRSTRGSWGDTSTLEGFSTHLFRKEYGTLQLSPKNNVAAYETMFYRIGVYAWAVLADFTPVGVILMLVGALSGRISWLSSALWATYVTYVLVFNYFANLSLDQPLSVAVFSRFWLQPNLVLSIWAGLGLIKVGNSKFCSKSLVYCAAVLSLGGYQITRNYASREESGMILHSYGEAILDTVPRGSIILSHSDINWNTFRYLLECESYRKDDELTHLSFHLIPYPWFKNRQQHLYPKIKFPKNYAGVSTDVNSSGNTKLILDFVRGNIKTHSQIYMDITSINVVHLGPNGVFANEFYLYPIGVLWKITSKPLKDRLWERKAARALKLIDLKYKQSVALKSSLSSWEFLSLRLYVDGMYQYAIRLLEIADNQGKTLSNDGLELYVNRLEIASNVMNKVASEYFVSVANQGHRDLIKNAAVANMRFYFAALSYTENIGPNLPTTAEKNKDLKSILRFTRKSLKRALQYDIDHQVVITNGADLTMEAFKEFLDQYH